MRRGLWAEVTDRTALRSGGREDVTDIGLRVAQGISGPVPRPGQDLEIIQGPTCQSLLIGATADHATGPPADESRALLDHLLT
jgi:hypothetical protein